MLDKIWDDVMAGPHPQRGLGKLRKKMNTNNISVITNNEGGDVGSSNQRSSLSMPSSPGAPATPTTPTTPSPTAVRKADNVWRSVFNPGSNLASRGMGSQVFDKPQPNSPLFMTGSTVGRLGASTIIEEGIGEARGLVLLVTTDGCMYLIACLCVYLCVY